MRRVAVYGATRNMYHQMTVAARSLLAHTRMDRVIFLTEDDDFPEELPAVIEVLNASGQTWFDPQGPNFASRWTWMTMMRLALPELLPDEDRCLWLDVDTIVNRDIGALFDLDLGENCFAMAEEPGRSAQPFRYHNAGVLLMDLGKLRGWRTRRMIDCVNTRKMPCVDQDAVNLLFQTEILTIGPEWNACEFTGQPAEARIVHYAGRQRYITAPLWKEYESMNWRDDTCP